MNHREKARNVRLKAKTRWRYLRRQVLGISQARVARLCNVSRGTVARWESPESRMLPDVGSILVLCEIMRYDPKVMIAWIAGGVDHAA
ncbi:MAG: helix-turn-helix transcriptional regulator [Christensenellales bacterium]|nr:helix-turn-helix transcriptional regulator [Christensenellales bacterium]